MLGLSPPPKKKLKTRSNFPKKRLGRVSFYGLNAIAVTQPSVLMDVFLVNQFLQFLVRYVM